MALLVTSWAGVKVHASVANARPIPTFEITFRISCNISFSPFSKLLLQNSILVELKLRQLVQALLPGRRIPFCLAIIVWPHCLRHNGSPGDSCRWSPRPCRGCRPCSGSSIDPCRGKNRRDALSFCRWVPRGRREFRGLLDCAPRRHFWQVDSNSQGDTSRRSTARRFPPY